MIEDRDGSEKIDTSNIIFGGRTRSRNQDYRFMPDTIVEVDESGDGNDLYDDDEIDDEDFVISDDEME